MFTIIRRSSLLKYASRDVKDCPSLAQFDHGTIKFMANHEPSKLSTSYKILEMNSPCLSTLDTLPQSVIVLGQKKKAVLGMNEENHDNTDESESTQSNTHLNPDSKNEISLRSRYPENTKIRGRNTNLLERPYSTSHVIQDDLNPRLEFATEEDEATYLSLFRKKLQFAKDYVLKEQVLGLDPDRPGSHESPIEIALRDGPMKIDISDLQLVRVLLEEMRKLKGLENAEGSIELEKGESLRDYRLFWTHLRDSLAVRMPGGDGDEKRTQAEEILREVFESPDHA